MKSTIRRKIPAGLLAMGVVVVFHFATPLALCGQESGSIGVQTRVVDARTAWTAHRLVEAALKARAKAGTPAGGDDVPHLPSEVTTFTELDGVVLRWEEGAGRARLTVADLTH